MSAHTAHALLAVALLITAGGLSLLGAYCGAAAAAHLHHPHGRPRRDRR